MEEFARAYINDTHPFARVGRQAQMVQARPKQNGIDRIFRYERLDLLIEFLCEKVGEDIEVGHSNVSPEMPYELSEECERELREYLTDEYRIYELLSRWAGRSPRPTQGDVWHPSPQESPSPAPGGHEGHYHLLVRVAKAVYWRKQGARGRHHSRGTKSFYDTRWRLDLNRSLSTLPVLPTLPLRLLARYPLPRG
jgi:hypothetical protein